MQQPNERSTSPVNLTTDQIQKYLDENKKLFVAIVNNQKQGNCEMSALYMNRLKSNLDYLENLANIQLQASGITLENFAEEETAMQTAQAAISHRRQPRSLASKVPLTLFPLKDQQQQPELANLQQQQHVQTQMGFFPPQSPRTALGDNYFPNTCGNSQDANAGGS